MGDAVDIPVRAGAFGEDWEYYVCIDNERRPDLCDEGRLDPLV